METTRVALVLVVSIFFLELAISEEQNSRNIGQKRPLSAAEEAQQEIPDHHQGSAEDPRRSAVNKPSQVPTQNQRQPTGQGVEPVVAEPPHEFGEELADYDDEEQDEADDQFDLLPRPDKNLQKPLTPMKATNLPEESYAKVVAAIIQEIDLNEPGGGSGGPGGDFTDDGATDELADIDADAAEKDRPKTEQEMRAENFFTEGQQFLNRSKGRFEESQIRKAYKLFDEAAALGHRKSQELVGFAYLFGDYLPWNPRKAREIFEDLAAKGSPRGQMGLGFMYTVGVTVNSSQAKALVYFTFAALGGDPWAQMALGYRYWTGINLQMNCESALTYYRKVAQRVAGEVSHGTGVAISRIRLIDEADGATASAGVMDNDLLQYYKFLADKGDVQAQVGLAQLYLTGGRGVEQNADLALHYFQEAADANNANAFAYLGKIYLDGTPTLKADNQTAYQYFKRAADKGNAVGQAGLGLMYLHGRGVEKDNSKALKFFQLAADQGYVDGQLQLGTMYFSGLGVKRDYKAAIKYFQLASQSGHVLAFYNLAQMHATGLGVMRNCHTATELYKNVAERGKHAEMMMQAHSSYRDGHVDQAALKYAFLAELGYEVAQSNIAYLLDTRQVQMFDRAEAYPRALLQWERAAEQGAGVARLKLGDYHYYGQGTVVDYVLAAHHYKVASEQQHNAQAMFNLAYMHEQGQGIKKDIHLAKRFYDLAAETSTDAQVPVAFALAKLGLVFALEYFRENSWWKLTVFDHYLGADWDIYLLTALLVLLGTLLYFRRPR